MRGSRGLAKDLRLSPARRSARPSRCGQRPCGGSPIQTRNQAAPPPKARAPPRVFRRSPKAESRNGSAGGAGGHRGVSKPHRGPGRRGAPCSGEGRTGGQSGSTRELRRIRPRPMAARSGMHHPCACCIAPMHRSKQGRDGNRGRRRARTPPSPQAGANMVGKLLIWSAVYQARIGAMHNQACCTAKKVTILDPVRRRRHT